MLQFVQQASCPQELLHAVLHMQHSQQLNSISNNTEAGTYLAEAALTSTWPRMARSCSADPQATWSLHDEQRH